MIPEPNGLERKLGLFPLTSIVVANMVGAGIFTTSGLLLRDLRHPIVLLGLWAFGGLIALCGALAYGELGAAIPKAGGEYAFLSDLFHPLLGFLSGWVSFFVGFSAPIAASAIGFSEYMGQAFPGLLSLGLGGAVVKKSLACGVILLFTIIHARGLELGSRVQNVLTVVKVALIVVLIGAGFLSGAGHWEHFTGAENFRWDFAGLKNAGLALMWILFAYSGWNASAYLGSEARNPARNLPRSLVLGTGLVILLYAGLNVLYIYAVPPETMSGVVPIAGLAAGRLFGVSIGTLMSLLVSFALFSSLSAYIILGPRVYFSMARDGRFFPALAKIHPIFKAPSRAVFLQGALSMVIVVTGSFDQILTYMGFSLGIFPLFAVLGFFKIRKRGGAGYRMPGFPIVPAIYLLAGTIILGLGFLRSPGPSLMALLTVAAGIPVYYHFSKKNRISTKRNIGHETSVS